MEQLEHDRRPTHVMRGHLQLVISNPSEQGATSFHHETEDTIESMLQISPTPENVSYVLETLGLPDRAA